MEEKNQNQVFRIDLKCIEDVRKLAKIPRQNILFCEGVEKININSSGTKIRILAITDQSISYFTDEAKPKKKISYGWTSIKGYTSIKEKQEIDLTFANGPFKFMSPKWHEIEKIIFDVLKHVLAADEWNALQIDTKKRYQIPRYNLPSASGVYSRYLSMLIQMHKKSPKAIERQFIKYIATYNKTFKLESDPDLPDIFILIGDALKPFTKLESLILPRFPDGAVNLYNDLAQILIQRSPIQHISIEDTPGKQFLAFCDSLKTSQITGLTFNDIYLSQDHLTILQESLVNIPFRSLSFQNAFDSSQFDFFSQEFLTGYITSHLLMLNLDKTVGIDIDKVIKDLPVICSLSFAYCDIDVAETLLKIEKAKLPHLKLLNLSGNIGKTFFKSSETNVLNELSRFDVNDVKWYPGVLPSFFNLLTSTKRDKGIRLYIERVTFETNEGNLNQSSKDSNDLQVSININIDVNGNVTNPNVISSNENLNSKDNEEEKATKKKKRENKKSKKNKENAEDELEKRRKEKQQNRKKVWSFKDWYKIGDILDSAEHFPLIELGWSGNPVSNSLISFLEKNELLTTLFLSDSFDPEDDYSLNLFASHVNNLDSLKNLVIKGVEDFKLGPIIFPILTSLQKNQSVTLLDVSDQCIGDKGINFISKIIEKNNIIQVITFDGSLFEQKESLINLLSVSDQRQRSIKISYPFYDIQRKIIDKTLTADDTSVFKQKLFDLRHFVRGVSKPKMTVDNDFANASNQKQRKVRTGSVRIQKYNKSKRSKTLNPFSESMNPKNPLYMSLKMNDDVRFGDVISFSDPSVFDKPFDFFISDFSDEFPLYVNDVLLKEYQINLQSLQKDNSPKKERSIKSHSLSNEPILKQRKHKYTKIVFLNTPEEFEKFENHFKEKLQEDLDNYYNENEELINQNQQMNDLDIDEIYEEQNEIEEKLDKLYDEEGFTKLNYKPQIQIVTSSDDSKYIEDIKQKYEFTALINALSTSK